MAKKDALLTEGRFREIFKEEFRGAFDNAFEPYALAIQKDFSDLRKGQKEIKEDVTVLKEDMNVVKEDLSEVKDTVNRIDHIQQSEIKRADRFSTRLKQKLA